MRTAKFIASLLHPMMMPVYATWLLFNTGSYLNFVIPSLLQYYIYIVMFVSSVLLPSLSAGIMVRGGMISSMEMEERRERHLPYITTLFCLIAGVFLLLKSPIPRIFGIVLGGGLLAVLISFLINLRWKISIHMIGIGGLMGLMSSYALLFNVNMILPLIVIAVLSGVLGTARLIRSTHTPAQIYAGFVIGFFAEFFYCWLLMRFIFYGTV